MGMVGDGGVLVNQVLDNSPASLAGIMRGDVIAAIAGVPMYSTGDVVGVVSHFKAGDNVNIRFLSNAIGVSLEIM